MNEPQVVSAVRVTIATACNERPRNEDAVGVGGWVLYARDAAPVSVVVSVTATRPGAVVVADGLGGQPDGHVAARLAAELLTGPGPDDVRDAFRKADAVLRAAATGPSRAMACTAVLVRVDADGEMTIANVGDVRAYRLVERYAAQLTEDHRALLESSTVLRCLGGTTGTTRAEPAVYPLTVAAGDRIVLCTDGVHDAVDSALIERLTGRSSNSSTIASALLDAARSGGTRDNATVAVLDILGPSRTRPQPVQRFEAAPAVEPKRGLLSRRRR